MNSKLYACLSVLVALSMQSLCAQTGTWSGNINVNGSELTLVFNIDGESSTLDVPDQGARAIPATIGITPLGAFKITVSSILAVFEGYYTGNLISGTFTQSGRSFPLILKPGVPKNNRPQTPQPPFPYATVDTSFNNGNVTLAGTLTLPQNYSRQTPVLIMVTGSGMQNRDEEIFEHHPFAVIADAFAREGIATLRYDDRGCGGSIGDVMNATTDDFRDDALAGIRFLRNRFDHVGILGHSEGGTIAFMLAASGEVDFTVSMAGMVVSGSETMLLQNRHALLKAGVPENVAEQYCKLMAETFAAVVSGDQLPGTADHDLPAALLDNYKAAAKQLDLPWMRHFLALDLRPRLTDIDCPVLALNGSLDTQVDAGLNLGALKDAGNSNIVIIEIPHVNHLFQVCSTGELEEYKRIEQTISPDVLKTMTDWINSLCNLAK